MSDEYYAQYQNYNTSYQLQATLFIVLSIVMIIISVLVLAAAFMLSNIIHVLSHLIKIARRSLRRAWVIIVVPLLTLSLSCLWIFMHAILIFLNVAKYGEFDAKYNTFVASGSAGQQFIYYGIMIFLIISMLFGVFLQLSILQFLAGSIVSQYYFMYRDRRREISFRRSIKHLFLHFGDLVHHAFVSTFLIWFRFIFEFISSRYVQLPEGKIRKMVEFSRSYVSLCSRYTLFEMAQSGTPYREARRRYIALMGRQTRTVGSVEGIITIFFLFSKVLIPIASWTLFQVLKNYADDQYESVILVWINIFSMAYGYLNASMALNLTEYILNIICYCYVVENAENGGAVYSVPEDFAQFVQTYAD